jgi:hypothetical protein
MSDAKMMDWKLKKYEELEIMESTFCDYVLNLFIKGVK